MGSKNADRDAELTRLWNAGEPTGNIGKALGGISGTRVSQIAKALGLTPRRGSSKTSAPSATRPTTRRILHADPPPHAPKEETQGAALSERELLKFLKEAGHVTYGPDDAGHYTVDRRGNLDGVGLLEIANLWRKRHGQPPLRLKTE